MRIMPLMFGIFLISLTAGLGFTSLYAQENPDELRGRIEGINREIRQIEEQQHELERQRRKEIPEERRREIETQLDELSGKRESLLREQERLEEYRQRAEETQGKGLPPEPSPDGESILKTIKQPSVIAAAIGAIGVIVAALIGLLKRK